MGAALKRLPAEYSEQRSAMHSTVCIVDDNQDVREVLARIVGSVGLKAELYDSAEAFLRRNGGTRIGCLLLDVQLGGMSGLELLAQLSEKQVGYPVFLISGLHDANTVAQAKAFRATVVDKPFDARALARKVLASVKAMNA